MSVRVEINSEELLLLVRQRSEKGFSVLYDNYSAALFGVISRIVKDNASAEDVLQESFVKIWRNIEQYDDCKGTFFTWMLNIARNASIDYVRSRPYLQKQRTGNEKDLNAPGVSPVSPDNIEHIGVRGMVMNMETQYSEILNLLYFNGYTQEEVSEALNIPLGTVKTRARRALQILRNQF